MPITEEMIKPGLNSGEDLYVALGNLFSGPRILPRRSDRVDVLVERLVESGISPQVHRQPNAVDLELTQIYELIFSSTSRRRRGVCIRTSCKGMEYPGLGGNYFSRFLQQSQ